MSEESPREKLAREIDDTAWSDLRSHAASNRMFVVAHELDLLDVAVAVAEDRTSEVETWIASGELVRPDRDQMQAFERAEGLAFRCVIVAPFVLAQELTGDDAADD